MSNVEMTGSNSAYIFEGTCDSSPEAYRLEVRMSEPDENGDITVYVPELPGVVSQAPSRDEALANIRDAFREVVASYKDAGQDIPWKKPAEQIAPDEISQWVIVDVEATGRHGE